MAVKVTGLSEVDGLGEELTVVVDALAWTFCTKVAFPWVKLASPLYMAVMIVITEISIARREAGSRHRRLPISVQRNFGRQEDRYRSKVLIGKILKRDNAGRDDSGWACVRDGSGECQRLANDHRREHPARWT